MSKEFARDLRTRMTDAEVRLWVNLRALRKQGLAFRRQSPLGDYVVDFECRKARLIIEVDGAQHEQSAARAYDEVRSAWLAKEGYLVLRLTNHNVLRATDIIVDEIVRAARERVAQRDAR
jgi:very-short-patch-repair endonuclease